MEVLENIRLNVLDSLTAMKFPRIVLHGACVSQRQADGTYPDILSGLTFDFAVRSSCLDRDCRQFERLLGDFFDKQGIADHVQFTRSSSAAKDSLVIDISMNDAPRDSMGTSVIFTESPHFDADGKGEEKDDDRATSSSDTRESEVWLKTRPRDGKIDVFKTIASNEAVRFILKPTFKRAKADRSLAWALFDKNGEVESSRSVDKAIEGMHSVFSRGHDRSPRLSAREKHNQHIVLELGNHAIQTVSSVSAQVSLMSKIITRVSKSLKETTAWEAKALEELVQRDDTSSGVAFGGDSTHALSKEFFFGSGINVARRDYVTEGFHSEFLSALDSCVKFRQTGLHSTLRLVPCLPLFVDVTPGTWANGLPSISASLHMLKAVNTILQYGRTSSPDREGEGEAETKEDRPTGGEAEGMLDFESIVTRFYEVVNEVYASCVSENVKEVYSAVHQDRKRGQHVAEEVESVLLRELDLETVPGRVFRGVSEFAFVGLFDKGRKQNVPALACSIAFRLRRSDVTDVDIKTMANSMGIYPFTKIVGGDVEHEEFETVLGPSSPIAHISVGGDHSDHGDDEGEDKDDLFLVRFASLAVLVRTSGVKLRDNTADVLEDGEQHEFDFMSHVELLGDRVKHMVNTLSFSWSVALVQAAMGGDGSTMFEQPRRDDSYSTITVTDLITETAQTVKSWMTEERFQAGAFEMSSADSIAFFSSFPAFSDLKRSFIQRLAVDCLACQHMCHCLDNMSAIENPERLVSADRAVRRDSKAAKWRTIDKLTKHAASASERVGATIRQFEQLSWKKMPSVSKGVGLASAVRDICTFQPAVSDTILPCAASHRCTHIAMTPCSCVSKNVFKVPGDGIIEFVLGRIRRRMDETTLRNIVICPVLASSFELHHVSMGNDVAFASRTIFGNKLCVFVRFPPASVTQREAKVAVCRALALFALVTFISQGGGGVGMSVLSGLPAFDVLNSEDVKRVYRDDSVFRAALVCLNPWLHNPDLEIAHLCEACSESPTFASALKAKPGCFVSAVHSSLF